MLLDFPKTRCLSRFQAGFSALNIQFSAEVFVVVFGDWSFNRRRDFHAPWPASSCRHFFFFFKSLKFIKEKMFPLTAWSLPSPSHSFGLLAAVCCLLLQLCRAPVMNPRSPLFVLRPPFGVEWRAGFRKTNSSFSLVGKAAPLNHLSAPQSLSWINPVI